MADEQVDVVVVGAGASGVPAAIGAARAGARVVLLEEAPVVGGTITGSYVAMPCGGPRTGVYQEMLARLGERHALAEGSRWFLPSAWLTVMGELLAAEPGLRVVCGARVRGALVEEGAGRPRVVGVSIAGPEGSEGQVRAAVTVDATGSGAVAVLAGCEALYGRDARSDFGEPHAPESRDDLVQQCTWMYVSQKLGSGPAFDMMRLEHVRRGVLDPALGWFHASPEKCLERDSGIYLHWGCAVACRDTRDPVALAEAQRDALAAMERDLALLREGGYGVHLAPRLGVRESRRVVGDHVIAEGDLRSGKFPDDTVAIGRYGLDIWGETLSREEAHVPAFGIPYRALVTKDVDGLLLAGKALSGTHVAMSAYRVQPILAAAGQAAGVAAALAARDGAPARDVDPAAVRDLLAGPAQGVGLEP